MKTDELIQSLLEHQKTHGIMQVRIDPEKHESIEDVVLCNLQVWNATGVVETKKELVIRGVKYSKVLKELEQYYRRIPPIKIAQERFIQEMTSNVSAMISWMNEEQKVQFMGSIEKLMLESNHTIQTV